MRCRGGRGWLVGRCRQLLRRYRQVPRPLGSPGRLRDMSRYWCSRGQGVRTGRRVLGLTRDSQSIPALRRRALLAVQSMVCPDRTGVGELQLQLGRAVAECRRRDRCPRRNLPTVAHRDTRVSSRRSSHSVTRRRSTSRRPPSPSWCPVNVRRGWGGLRRLMSEAADAASYPGPVPPPLESNGKVGPRVPSGLRGGDRRVRARLTTEHATAPCCEPSTEAAGHVADQGSVLHAT